jgi:hypothetical protein
LDVFKTALLGNPVAEPESASQDANPTESQDENNCADKIKPRGLFFLYLFGFGFGFCDFGFAIGMLFAFLETLSQNRNLQARMPTLLNHKTKIKMNH